MKASHESMAVFNVPLACCQTEFEQPKWASGVAIVTQGMFLFLFQGPQGPRGSPGPRVSVSLSGCFTVLVMDRSLKTMAISLQTPSSYDPIANQPFYLKLTINAGIYFSLGHSTVCFCIVINYKFCV